MKWTGMFLIAYFIVIGGIVAALWKFGALADVGTTWTLKWQSLQGVSFRTRC